VSEDVILADGGVKRDDGCDEGVDERDGEDPVADGFGARKSKLRGAGALADHVHHG
jgi:hypothetical protein